MKLFEEIFAFLCYLGALYYYAVDDMKRFELFALLAIANLVVSLKDGKNDSRF